ncbi:PAAR domain-containing protein [Pseudomonas lijiangensis]|uniref:PAAR domain-containing protein n=1 Tax=Pseudomonas lijiangensis TaxID=2995658 RepID=A0ABX8HQM1_9PSED|nr:MULTISPECIES: PAAR domain-containing protein [Pseudomonas syringae group]MBX8493090.1 PAAR domain-containing protein [Pseudomonas cichorii]MBX8501363.1 PAAR domain-containing protein [Pseudomonas lijiangensis]MBX8506198.1 PAAR domain-containing protein [Pseudomonas lijiangensis]MBX8521426.1 PAAR domain-containing protein [Pseudomonas cichorii]MBX8552458.1 PAAR domain-containing protein [Pseudomonas cichorii]
MAKPAARITDPTSCPLPGHGPKAVASGSPDVFFDGLAAATKGDTCTCGSILTSAVSTTVFINGKNAALVGTVGTHGDVVVGGSGTVIIGDSHTPATFIPPLPLLLKKTYGHTFSIVDSETGQPLAGRSFTASVDGKRITGITDSSGIAHIKTPIKDASISVSIDFNSPARLLSELTE